MRSDRERESAGEDVPADEPLREEDVTLGDRLDDRVQETDELPDEDDN